MTEPNKNPNLGVSNLDIIYAIENISFSPNTAGTDGQTASAFTAVANFGFNGGTMDRVRVPNVFKYSSNASVGPSGTFTIWTPASGKKFRLMGGTLSAATASPVLFRDGAGGTNFNFIHVPANDSRSFDLGNGYLSTAANNVLEILNAGASTTTIRVSFFGTEE